MVARRKPVTPGALRVTFHRDGETPLLIEAENGDKALWRTIKLLLAHRELRAGDVIAVSAAE